MNAKNPDFTKRPDFTKQIIASIIVVATLCISTQAIAADLVCTGPQMGEIFVDLTGGKVTKSADESLSVVITTENSNYSFVFKGKTSKFKATINRANGQITLDDACTPECWGGPIFGTCTAIKAKL